jgi:glycosyltransferase involved in cell wall biosynthesis
LEAHACLFSENTVDSLVLRRTLEGNILKIMIVKSAAWDYEAFYKSKHPEYVAIRNLISQNPQHDFILIGHGRNFEHFKFGKILIYNLGSGNKFRYLLSQGLNFLLPLFLRPSVVVGMGGSNLIPTGFASALTRAKFIPVIVIDLWYSLSEMPVTMRSLIKELLRATLLTSYAVLAISESIRKELVEVYNMSSEKVLVYKYKISDIFNPNVPNDLKKTLNPSGPVVLTICRINPQKGLEYLVKASQAVAKKVPNVRFVVRAYASEVGYRSSLLNLISECNVQGHFKILEEFSPYEEIPRYMAASDVFVLPSISEGLAVVILEAMACGVPVIGSKIGGISDVVVDGYNGLLVEPRDVQGLADAIIRVLSDENLRHTLSCGALSTTQRVKQNEFQSLLSKLIIS